MPTNNFENLFQQQKKNSWILKSAPWKQRLDLLKKLKDKILENQQNIVDAMTADFQKPEEEILVTEIYPCLHELRGTLSHLSQWVQPQEKPSSLLLFGTQSWVQYEPKGCVLIISPWNYPFSLAIVPLISALAAGNTVVIKPSELTPQTSRVIKNMLESIFPTELVSVIEGGKEVSEQLLQLPFDHIFFTGSTPVGKIVMQAAAKNLTPVTLELGGKSPTILDDSADLALAASKIIWGKFLNSGQTCVAPDYVFVSENKYSDFIRFCQRELVLQKSIGSLIITSHHQQRLQNLLTEALKMGAQSIPVPAEEGGLPSSARRFPPTLLKVHDAKTCQLMKEEIFGPILPILTYQNIDEVLSYIQSHPKPLALYLFCKDKKVIEKVLSQTSSGGVCINDVILHLGNHHLPFGGIGESGMGHYHGQYGFMTFSHQRSVLQQGPLARMINLFYPPYSPLIKKILRIFIRTGL